MRINPLRIPWRSLTESSSCVKRDVSEYAVKEAQAETSRSIPDSTHLIYQDGTEAAETSQPPETFLERSFGWLRGWRGNLLPTLREFEEETKWIHVLSARCADIIRLLTICVWRDG